MAKIEPTTACPSESQGTALHSGIPSDAGQNSRPNTPNKPRNPNIRGNVVATAAHVARGTHRAIVVIARAAIANDEPREARKAYLGLITGGRA